MTDKKGTSTTPVSDILKLEKNRILVLLIKILIFQNDQSTYYKKSSIGSFEAFYVLHKSRKYHTNNKRKNENEKETIQNPRKNWFCNILVLDIC